MASSDSPGSDARHRAISDRNSWKQVHKRILQPPLTPFRAEQTRIAGRGEGKGQLGKEEGSARGTAGMRQSIDPRIAGRSRWAKIDTENAGVPSVGWENGIQDTKAVGLVFSAIIAKSGFTDAFGHIVGVALKLSSESRPCSLILYYSACALLYLSTLCSFLFLARNYTFLSCVPFSTNFWMTSTGELLHAEAELWCHAFGYLKSMALQCAIKLGIPNAIHRHGGTASLSELHLALPIAASKRACLSRIMTFLAASGIFRQEIPVDGEVVAGVRYSITPASRLLVDDHDCVSSSHHTCLSQFMLLCCSRLNFRASQSLADWLRDDATAAAAETPFMMANGASFYGLASRDAEFGARFSEGMGSDSRFVAEILAGGGCAPVFAGLTSLVDVGGGDGTTARAIARAYPHVRCSVLELPQVVDAMPPADCAVEFVAGDMMEYIPPADAVLLKFVLHNWSDEECVRILKLSKEAISTREPKGKVIIIDVVLGSSPSKQTLEAQLLLDLCMMVILPGKEREEEKWHKIFLDAGLTRYKISPVLGSRSLIEVYP